MIFQVLKFNGFLHLPYPEPTVKFVVLRIGKTVVLNC